MGFKRRERHQGTCTMVYHPAQESCEEEVEGEEGGDWIQEPFARSNTAQLSTQLFRPQP